MKINGVIIAISLVQLINYVKCASLKENIDLVNANNVNKSIEYNYNANDEYTFISSAYENPIILPVGYDNDIAFYHWFPWKKPKHYVLREDEHGEEHCEEESSINEFPDDIFTQEQRLQGAIALHFFAVIYFFTVSGLVINYYFIPSVQCICEDLKISPDVGAAVFMATATATPELFTNVISTFIADSDMGLGTIIGSLMWNILGVAALSSFATRKAIKMDWFPITRDSIMFFINVGLLIIVSWDGQIMWWEALILVLFIFVYYAIMFQTRRFSAYVKQKFEVEYPCCGSSSNYDLEKDEVHQVTASAHSVVVDTKPSIMEPHFIENKVLIISDDLTEPRVSVLNIKVPENKILSIAERSIEPRRSVLSHKSFDNKNLFVGERATQARMSIFSVKEAEGISELNEKMALEKAEYQKLKLERLGLWKLPRATESRFRRIFWFYSWPIRFVLACTMPNPRVYRKFYPLTFLICVVWIGAISYMIFFMLIVISYTFNIPESVMGITVFAIGGCTPEMITGLIMARRGHPGTGIANSFGASSLGILMCLGLPWFIKILMLMAQDGDQNSLPVDASTVRYTMFALGLVPVVFYIIMAGFKFTFRKTTGIFLATSYILFVSFAILVELQILFPNGREC